VSAPPRALQSYPIGETFRAPERVKKKKKRISAAEFN